MPVRILNTPQGRQTKSKWLLERIRRSDHRKISFSTLLPIEKWNSYALIKIRTRLTKAQEKEPEGKVETVSQGEAPVVDWGSSEEANSGQKVSHLCISKPFTCQRGNRHKGDFRKGFLPVKKTVREFSDSRRIGSQIKRTTVIWDKKYPRSINVIELIAWLWGETAIFSCNLSSRIFKHQEKLVFLVYLSCKVSLFPARKTMPTQFGFAASSLTPLKVGRGPTYIFPTRPDTNL